jgi:hypothetical protein
VWGETGKEGIGRIGRERRRSWECDEGEKGGTYNGRLKGETETERQDVTVVHLAESVLDTVVRVLVR